MQSMSVHTGRVSDLSGKIGQGATGIREELNTLEAEVSKLRGAWNGAAQSAYTDAQKKWTTSVTELQQLLAQIATKTQEMSQDYTTRDNSSARRFQ